MLSLSMKHELCHFDECKILWLGGEFALFQIRKRIYVVLRKKQKKESQAREMGWRKNGKNNKKLRK